VNQTMRMLTINLFAALVLAACGGDQAAPAASPAPAAATADTTAEATAAAAGAGEAAGGAVSGQRTFVIVPEQSKASYVVDEEFFGGALAKYGIAARVGETVGSTQQIEGQLQLKLDDLSAPLGENRFTVQMNTMLSDQDLRDTWIRENGPRFNDYPEATFVATAVEGAPASYADGQEVSFKLVGDLTVRDITRPVTFDVNAQLAGDTLSGTATASVKLSDFGIEPPSFANTLTVADDFRIEVQFVAKG
jgi:polyisoprenoid-binding protein YceI